MERECIFRLPYFDLDKECTLLINDKAQNEGICDLLSKSWLLLIQKQKAYENWTNVELIITDLVKKYFGV